VHSPFVFDLLKDVIEDKKEYYAYSEVESLRAQLLTTSKIVSCKDLGAGSLKNSTSKKEVKVLAKRVAKSPKYAKLLFRLVKRFQPVTTLELGTSLGISSSYIAKANSSSNFITIEGCPEIATIAKENFDELNIKNIQLVVGNFDDELTKILKKTETLDFVFFDGNHRKQPTLNYFHQCLEKANDSSVFVFDDIYWSSEMKEAWNEIKKHKKVTVTIDLFFLGIVFFREEQAKQDFILRF
jgi:predicted O-methyltransferase YrrM